jgi:hypothetical protein
MLLLMSQVFWDEMLCIGWIVLDILKDRGAFSFWVKQSKKKFFLYNTVAYPKDSSLQDGEMFMNDEYRRAWQKLK